MKKVVSGSPGTTYHPKKGGEPQTTIDNTILVQIFLQQICLNSIPRDRLNQILIRAHEVKAGAHISVGKDATGHCLGSWGPNWI